MGGPLRVEDTRYRQPLSQAWVDAAVAAGLPVNDEFSGPTQEGVDFYQVTQRTGRRWSAANAYLHPAKGRDNLIVATVARCHRRHRRERPGRRDALRAARHPAGGASPARGGAASPHLLLLSGIGPADHLRAHGIDVVADVPGVGAGLQDHPACFPVWQTPTTRNLWEDATPEHMELCEREGREPMASHGIEAGSFARSDGDLAAPDRSSASPPDRLRCQTWCPPSGWRRSWSSASTSGAVGGSRCGRATPPPGRHRPQLPGRRP